MDSHPVISIGNTRVPFLSLQRYPDLLKEQDPFRRQRNKDEGSNTSKSSTIPGNKHVIIKNTAHLAQSACTLPPPPPPPPPIEDLWRPRRGSEGSVRPPANTRKHFPRIPSPLLLLRSKSSVGLSQPNISPRERSHSSSSASSTGNATTFIDPSVEPLQSLPREDSIKWLMSNLSIRRHKYGEVHPRVGRAWNVIGNYFFRVCQYSHALGAYKHAVLCFKACEPELACTYSNLGAVYWASGQADNAISFLQKALDIFELNLVMDGNNPNECLAVASTLFQMGLCKSILKEHKEAMALLKRCQKIQGRILGPMDVQVGRTLDAIGKVYYMKEEFLSALHCHEEARRIKSATPGNETAVAISMLNIAAVHRATKNWNVAISNYTRAMYLQKSELVRCRNQKGRPVARAAQEVGETLTLMGDLHLQIDKQEQAERLYKEAALVYREAVLGENPASQEELRTKIMKQ